MITSDLLHDPGDPEGVNPGGLCGVGTPEGPLVIPLYPSLIPP